MSKPRILHILAPGDNASPFDVNMAADAGYDIIIPYNHIGAENIRDYIQDAIFSRPPGMHKYTGAFIGGWDVNLAAEMLACCRQALVPPFEISVFADPNGAYTTAAALTALVGRQLKIRENTDFTGLNIAIFGGGPVGLCAGILMARQGGSVHLVRLTRPSAQKQAEVSRFAARYDVELINLAGHDDEQKRAALESAHIAITTAKEGVQILSDKLLKTAQNLIVAADVNAVPPAGVEGIDPNDNGAGLAGLPDTAGIGALTIGNIKYKVQHSLFERMLNSDRALLLDFPDAYQLALELV